MVASSSTTIVEEVELQVQPDARAASQKSQITITTPWNDAQSTQSILSEPIPPDAVVVKTLPKVRTWIIVTQLSAVNFLGSFANGIIIIALPVLANQLHLPAQLYLWPTSVYGLTSGSMLLLAGAVGDVIGNRAVDLIGCFLAGIFLLACGFCQTGIQLVLFRAFQGVAMAMHMPCSVGIIAQYMPSGKGRNIAFSCLGLAQPFGFAVGLVVSGIIVNTIGWRSGFYIAGVGTLISFAVGVWAIPKPEGEVKWQKLRTDVDWVGALIASGSLSMLSYVLAMLSTGVKSIEKPTAIVLLIVSVLLGVAFPLWNHRQEKKGKVALIPNSIWRKLPFTSVCLMVIISWGCNNAFELSSSLFFQEVQELSALQASLRLIPPMVVGMILNFTTGYFIDRTPAYMLVFVSTLFAAGAPLIMALVSPHLGYWKGVFFAQAISPASGDVLFTVGLIVVSEIFPEKTQALAGAVFNTVAQFGLALGVSLMQVVSMQVTQGTSYADKESPQALLVGYRVGFWAIFGALMLAALICAIGLRRVGKVGLKRE